MAKKFAKKVNSKGLAGALARQNLKEQERKRIANKLDAQKEQKIQKQKSIAQGKGGSTKQKAQQQRQQEQKGIKIPFNVEDKVLLVGEGDFSFARSIVNGNFVQPKNVIATSFDSKEELLSKYPETAENNLKFLAQEGVDVRFEIDATKLPETLKIKLKSSALFKDNQNLDYVVFNFPHTGRGMKDQDRNIRDHQKLMLQFFQSCKRVFKLVNNQTKNDFGGYNYGGRVDSIFGKIIVSLFEGEPYRSWTIKSIARSEGLRLEKSGLLDWKMLPEYHHRRTNGVRDTTKPAPEREARMYVFEDFNREAQLENKRKKKSNDGSDDDE
ncbi:25S rRNA (uridine(2634)-N(3))-methyltransferase [[Candida] railenensis]|uniref:25S rRNA (Uridine(2634)-N(3))-methyltransferase n=1 Tax=[Candida] railenensis TaxID=45579 RepID=A0A9P0QRN8_9ASCO|nr:25S rRNA (uridine(2634)-N(3))-methyltransferase [[Candida] railenensis]